MVGGNFLGRSRFTACLPLRDQRAFGRQIGILRQNMGNAVFHIRTHRADVQILNDFGGGRNAALSGRTAVIFAAFFIAQVYHQRLLFFRPIIAFAIIYRSIAALFRIFCRLPARIFGRLLTCLTRLFFRHFRHRRRRGRFRLFGIARTFVGIAGFTFVYALLLAVFAVFARIRAAVRIVPLAAATRFAAVFAGRRRGRRCIFSRARRAAEQFFQPIFKAVPPRRILADHRRGRRMA